MKSRKRKIWLFALLMLCLGMSGCIKQEKKEWETLAEEESKEHIHHIDIHASFCIIEFPAAQALCHINADPTKFIAGIKELKSVRLFYVERLVCGDINKL